MRFNHLFRVLIIFCLSLPCQLVHAEPMLNGIGVHQELGREVFIGALFSESLSNDAETLINTNQPMRMELKIVAPDGLTTRRFSRMWIEGMAVNSKSDALTAQADNMVKFDGLFKSRFMVNDFIRFTNLPGKGVDIALNGILIGNIQDNAFFSMLLSTWIGKIPLSSDYRDSLLKVGDVDTGLRSRFDAIAPSSSRITDVKTWTSPSVDVKPPKPTEALAVKENPTPKADKLVVAKTDLPKLDVPKIEKPILNIPATPTPQTEKPATASSASSLPAKSVAVASSTEIDEDEEDGPALTAQSLLARQFYVSDAIKKIRGNTRYPQRALDRGQAGTLRVAIVIDRMGNILNTSLLESSKYELLNREALEAIKRSAPFTQLPETMAGARFEFSVPMRWALPE
jgi:periplasmic protein TonB